MSLCILDGGMGRELLKRGAPFAQPQWSALALMQAPEYVLEVHRDFRAAGAQVLTTNSYALVPFHLGQAVFDSQAESLAALAGKLARQAADEGQNIQVAASIPPLFGSYRPDLFDSDQAEKIARPLILGQSPYADLWLVETISSLTEAQTVRALLPEDGKPVWLAFTLEDEKATDTPYLRSGEALSDILSAILALNVQAVLFNCSRPEMMAAAIERMREAGNRAGVALAVGVYANAFSAEEEPLAANEALSKVREDITPQAYLDWAKRWHAAGAEIIGGCCGIGPEHIALLSDWQTDVNIP